MKCLCHTVEPEDLEAVGARLATRLSTRIGIRVSTATRVRFVQMLLQRRLSISPAIAPCHETRLALQCKYRVQFEAQRNILSTHAVTYAV